MVSLSPVRQAHREAMGNIVFQRPALMFAVKSLDAVHHPGCAQALIFKETPKAGGGPRDDS